MKKLLIFGVAALSLTACTSEDIMEQNAANEIRYTVQTERGTRATDVYCPNNMHSHFKLYAATTDNGRPFIVGDDVTRNGNTWNNATKRFWPAEALNFYAFENDQNSFNWENKTFENFQVNPNVAQQNDLLYAFAKNVQKEETADSKTLDLNFRHALSQVVFRAKNTSTCYYIECYGVEVHNLYSKGTYTFPTETTTSNIPHNPGLVDTDNNNIIEWYAATRGSWALNDQQTNGYSVSGLNLSLFKGGATGNLTDVENGLSDEHETEGQFANAMLLLPQQNQALNLKEMSEGATGNGGSYFVLNCRIWNIADAENTVYTEDEVTEGKKLFNKNDEVIQYEGAIWVPAAIDWKEGYKYIYTFVLGGEGQGFTPGPDPHPVFVPITYSVTVDEFIPWYNQDLDLNDEKDDPAA